MLIKKDPNIQSLNKPQLGPTNSSFTCWKRLVTAQLMILSTFGSF